MEGLVNLTCIKSQMCLAVVEGGSLVVTRGRQKEELISLTWRSGLKSNRLGSGDGEAAEKLLNPFGDCLLVDRLK